MYNSTRTAIRSSMSVLSDQMGPSINRIDFREWKKKSSIGNLSIEWHHVGFQARRASKGEL